METAKAKLASYYLWKKIMHNKKNQTNVLLRISKSLDFSSILFYNICSDYKFDRSNSFQEISHSQLRRFLKVICPCVETFSFL